MGLNFEKVGNGPASAGHDEAKDDKGVFSWVKEDDCRPDRELLKNAKERSLTFRENPEMDFLSFIAGEIMNDFDGKPSDLLRDYEDASTQEKRTINGVLMDLTGHNMNTLLRLWWDREVEKTLLEKRAWKAPQGYIAVHGTVEGWDYTLYSTDYQMVDKGQINEPGLDMAEVFEMIADTAGWDTADCRQVSYDTLDAVAQNYAKRGK